jgi:hypothetical protein
MFATFAEAAKDYVFPTTVNPDFLSETQEELETKEEVDLVDEKFEPLVLIAEPVQKRFVGPLILIAIFSVFACCSGATYIVRSARDSRITLNAINIRRQYQRNM